MSKSHLKALVSKTTLSESVLARCRDFSDGFHLTLLLERAVICILHALAAARWSCQHSPPCNWNWVERSKLVVDWGNTHRPVHCLRAGHAIGIIVADTEAAAQAASRAVAVTYQDIMPILSIDQAMEANSYFEVLQASCLR